MRIQMIHSHNQILGQQKLNYRNYCSSQNLKTNLQVCSESNNNLKASHCSFYSQNSHFNEGNLKSNSPILQPQQPENCLIDVQKYRKSSLITCRSQPQNKKKIRRQFNENRFNDHNQNRSNHNSKQKIYFEENKKTRKYFTKRQNNEDQEVQKINQEYYKFGKARQAQQQNYQSLMNQKTLKMNKKSCNHKSHNNNQQVASLQDLQSRVTMCEAYVQLSERKTNLLAHQVDYLMMKEYRKQQLKMKRLIGGNTSSPQYFEKKQSCFKNKSNLKNEVNLEKLKYSKGNKFVLNNEQLKNKGQFLPENAKTNAKIHKHNMQGQYSLNKFHYRSNDNKQSRMKKLIYFHERGNHKKSCKNKNNQNMKKSKNQENQSFIKTLKQIPIKLNFQQNSRHHKHYKHKDQLISIQKLNLDHKQEIKKFQKQRKQQKGDIQIKNTSTQNNQNQMEFEKESEKHFEEENNILRKSKAKYKQNQSSSYLLQEDVQNSKANDRLKLNFKLINSQKMENQQFSLAKHSSESKQKIDRNITQDKYKSSQNKISFQNKYRQQTSKNRQRLNKNQQQYLTRQFQLSEDNVQNNKFQDLNSLSERQNIRLKLNYQSSSSNLSSRKVGHFRYTQISNQQNALQSSKRNSRHHLQKSKQKSVSLLKNKQIIGKNSQQVYKKYCTSKKVNSQQQYQIIESNLSSSLNTGQLKQELNCQNKEYSENYPQHYTHSDAQIQIMNQFDVLVLKAAEEPTPLKKKIIREQIYRTSRQMKQLHKFNEQKKWNKKHQTQIKGSQCKKLKTKINPKILTSN